MQQSGQNCSLPKKLYLEDGSLSLSPGSAEWRSLIVEDDIKKETVQAQPVRVLYKARVAMYLRMTNAKDEKKWTSDNQGQG